MKLAVMIFLVIGGFAGILWDSRQPSLQVLSSFETRLDGRMSNQRHNALLALSKLDGQTVDPGEIFSFNERVGSCTRDQGYRKAPVSYNGQLIPSWGGGVCQTSTTLYNAALLGGLEIVERWPHRFAPSYVAPGRDAAVAYPSYDLRFRNNLRTALTIRARRQGSGLLVEFMASEVPKQSVRCYTQLVDRREPRTYEYGMSRPGRQRVRNSGKPGYEVVVFRELDGRRELVSVDSYPEMNRIVDFR